MRTCIKPQACPSTVSTLQCVMLTGALLVATLLTGVPGSPQSPTTTASKSAVESSQGAPAAKARHRHAKKAEPVAVAETPPPPHWPVNDSPNPASVIWDSNGLRINASNSSLQQILNEVSTETGTKVEGTIPDQRVYGAYGPGQARDVLFQLLQGSDCNVLLAGDLGKGAPRQIVLTPRRAGAAKAPNSSVNAQQQRDPDEDIPEEQPEEQPQVPPPPPVQQPQQPQMPNNFRPGFGPNGPIRTPQQVIEEMQQRQMQQQQQLQQQQQQQNPQ